jgi:hypothetical protein
MWLVRRGCQEIMELHRARQTECFYEKMLACYLYERGVPYMTQACFGCFEGDMVVLKITSASWAICL